MLTLRDRFIEVFRDNDMGYHLGQKSQDKFLSDLENAVKDWLHDGATSLHAGD